MRVDEIGQAASKRIGLDRGYVAESIAADWAMSHSLAIRDLVANPQVRPHIIAEQLAALFLNTICVVRQYNVSLKRRYDARKLGFVMEANLSETTETETTIDFAAERLLSYTRRMVGTLSAYHGWNHDDELRSLGEHIADIHQMIYLICARKKFDLISIIHETMDRACRFGENRSTLTDVYHPSVSPVLGLFNQVKLESVCTFAKPSYAWAGRRYADDQTLSANLLQNMGTFARFARSTPHEDIDAFLLAFPARFGKDTETLARLTKSVLSFYSSNDPKNEASLERMSEPNWRFSFNGMKMFVQTFAPCYKANNTRYVFAVDATFVQFVSDEAFHRYISREPGKWEEARLKIRKRAADMTQPYSIPEHEALTFVHPLQAGQPPIQWKQMEALNE